MINKFADGKVPEPGEWDEADKRIPEIAREAIDSAGPGLRRNLAFSEAWSTYSGLLMQATSTSMMRSHGILQRATRAGAGLAPSSTIWPKP